MTTAAGDRAHAELLRRYWGFDTLRPLQSRAVEAGVQRRDSLVVMPTGGGKSLCFQLPPLITRSLTVVVSPLIALMKDQVDGLVLSGYPAACLNSHTSPDETRATMAHAESGALRLLYVAPERLFLDRFLAWLQRVNPASFAVDEAHCISAWGHDFRPEYRRLADLRRHFPRASLHAFTATATPRVRDDIVQLLGLRSPEVLVGVFDRPNLTYRVIPRTDPLTQARETVARHAGSAVIIYCISRKETEQLAASLRLGNIKARAYHAGLAPDERRNVQDEFSQEKLNVVVATVAFGMGIDRGDVRCVLHTAHPKSVEAYQQETGRAGRDGLPAECVLLYSGGDTSKWINLIERSAAESEAEVAPEWIEHQIEHVRAMQRFCLAARCRHQRLAEYFGQNYVPPSTARAHEADASPAATPSAFGCGACDACLGELEADPDSLVVAQKIVSCVARIAAANQDPTYPLEFGAAHLAQVLVGGRAKAVLQHGHDQLSTFGLLRDLDRALIVSYINQLVDLGVLRRAPGTFPTISLGEKARAVLRGELNPTLRRAASLAAPPRKKRGAEELSDPLAAELFELLRALRRGLAQERTVPAYMIFGDRTLQAMATLRPVSMPALRSVPGVGEQKAREFGDRFLDEIARFCQRAGITGAARPSDAARSSPRGSRENPDLAPVRRSLLRERLDRLWDHGATIDEACEQTKLKPSTVAKYLEEYIEQRAASGTLNLAAWVDAKTYAAIIDAASKTGADRLRPIFEFLGERVPYEQIRLALAHDRVTRGGMR